MTLPLSTAIGVDGRAPTAPTASCVLPTALPNVSLPATGRMVIVVFRVARAPEVVGDGDRDCGIHHGVVGVPDTMPVVGAIERPAGSPVALHVKLDPVLPVWVKVNGPYAVLNRPSARSTGSP